MAVPAPKNFGRKPTEDIAKAVAMTWLSSPGNKMQLNHLLTGADKDGDGTIDKDEFKELLASTGGGKLTDAQTKDLFAEFDADGDGELTALEIQQLQDKKRKKASLRARNN